MLIAISGSQGSGKSTILDSLQNLGYKTIKIKTARSILADWNVTLDTVNNDLKLKQAFQQELITRKHKDELDARYSDELIFTERAYTDLFIYTMISFGQYNTYSTWLSEYYNTCTNNNNEYEKVYYIRQKFGSNVENDGIRSINPYYSRMIDTIMLDFTLQMTHSDNLTVIDTLDLSERIELITKNIK